jgi:hypothetical protein
MGHSRTYYLIRSCVRFIVHAAIGLTVAFALWAFIVLVWAVWG